MLRIKSLNLALALVFIGALSGSSIVKGASPAGEVLAHWSFEQVKHLKGDSVSTSIVGQPLTAGNRGPIEPQPFVFDESGKGNFLQVQGSRPSPIVFSDNVPSAMVDGKPNARSLTLRNGEYVVTFDRPLAYYDMQKSWKIEASLRCNLLGTEQVFLCKEGAKGQLTGDVSIGFDNMYKKYFVEMMCADGVPRRIVAGDEVEAGKWYDVRAQADYDSKSGQTQLHFEVKLSGQTNFGKPSTITFNGRALRSDAGLWVIGRGFPGGFPNSLQVLDGGIDEVKISGEALPRVAGQNPLFTDAFTADPAITVIGNKVYAYVGQDKATVGGWFNMPNWLCYSTTDMKNWTAHGTVLAAKDFINANSGSAWAAQVVEKDGKYYYYVTLDGKEGHFITVAVSDTPTGPFKEACPGKPLITDAMTTDSHRSNADIDPTIFIDDDGTPWMAWGNGDCYLVKLKRNMVELDGPITKVPYRNYSEGPWLFKRGDLYYNVYAADAPGVQAEQICYSTAKKITGPWTYGGFVTGPAKHGFTIHPSVIEFKGQWYFFYHDGSYTLNGTPGGDCRRQVCAEYLYFNPDGSIKPITLTSEGVSILAKNR
ncbi:glycoside hydrolase family 43 protein [uncultured Bacteroides sp.]|uniref:glycoside hydrolase family 43 protein n=1 Tax=uncultured Bacteroides sp. TaxID=162156 RepID=UPI002AA8F9E8|nr:glycoside hydrolase family 43 protein [uncultured Bacteroides sp.]